MTARIVAFAAVAALVPAASSSTKVTVYSSLPLDSIDRPQTRDAIRGEQMALARAHGRVGRCRIAFKSLDDSTPQAGQWDPGTVASNARKATQDRSAIAYLGEWNSGASAISIPITNTAGLMQISPSNSALELTKSPGAPVQGAPDKYYPTGRRTYARVAPADHIQGGALGEWMKELGVTKLFEATDKQVYGVGVAKTTGDAAKLNGIQVVGNEGIDIKASNYRALARKIKESGADAFFFGGITASNAVQLYEDVWAANPGIKLFGPDGVAETSFTSKLPADAQPNTFITVGTYDPADYPAPAQRFFKAFEAKYHRQPEPYAIYGYEAMSLLLDSMRRAGTHCNSRRAVIRQVFRTRCRRSVLGTYRIDKDGDITTSRFGRFLVKQGRLVYDRTAVVRTDSFGHPLGSCR